MIDSAIAPMRTPCICGYYSGLASEIAERTAIWACARLRKIHRASARLTDYAENSTPPCWARRQKAD